MTEPSTGFLVYRIVLLPRTMYLMNYSLLGSLLLAGVSCRMEHIRTEDIDEAWTVFSGFRDKRWSFTDCTSRVVMARLNVKVACAFDEHFRQFGTVIVVP